MFWVSRIGKEPDPEILIEDTIQRSLNRFLHGGEAIESAAANLFADLVINHDYIDGNKRITTLAIERFLEYFEITIPEERMEKLKSFTAEMVDEYLQDFQRDIAIDIFLEWIDEFYHG